MRRDLLLKWFCSICVIEDIMIATLKVLHLNLYFISSSILCAFIVSLYNNRIFGFVSMCAFELRIHVSLVAVGLYWHPYDNTHFVLQITSVYNWAIYLHSRKLGLHSWVALSSIYYSNLKCFCHLDVFEWI